MRRDVRRRRKRRLGAGSMSTSSTSSATSAPSETIASESRLHPRAGPFRLDHDRGRVDDRLGHFYRSADIARQTGSAGGLLTAWVITGVLTVCRGAFLRRTGGDDAQGRRAIRLPARILLAAVGFSVRLDAFSGDPDGHDRRGGGGLRAISRRALCPAVSPMAWIVAPMRSSDKYAVSLSLQQFVAILLIAFLTAANTRGLNWGKYIQNIFTSAKTLALIGLVIVGIFLGRNAAAIQANFASVWAVQGATDHRAGRGFSAPVDSRGFGSFGSFGGLSSRSASRRWVRFFRPMPGTTSPSRPAK